MSVFKHRRTGRWVAQVSEHGRKRQIGTFATKREADAAIRVEEQKGPRSGMTVAQWRDRWLAADRWKEGTRAHNMERTKAFAEKHGDRPLRSVNRTIARDWVTANKSTHGALSAMFGAAMYEDDEHGNQLLAANPFSKLVRKKRPKRSLPGEWLTDEDVTALEAEARKIHGIVFGETVACMIRFAAETGIRPGELFPLTDEDLDLEDGVLHVRRAAESRTRTIDTPKNGEARDIVLSAAAAEAAARCPRITGQRTIFGTKTGKQFWGSTLSMAWAPVCAAAGRPGMDFYLLRHYCASRLFNAGLDYPDIAVQLGHTDGGALARQVYVHALQREQLDRVRSVLDGEAA